jgi:hypothetical protein
MSSLKKILFEKNGIKIQKEKEDEDDDKFTITFFLENKEHIDITHFVSIDFLKLVHDLNPDIFESIHIHKFSEKKEKEEEEANVLFIFKDLFGDIGLPQFYMCFNIVLSPNEAEGGEKTFILTPLEKTGDVLELKQNKVEIQFRKCTLVCKTISEYHIDFCLQSVLSANNLFSTSYIEKMASMLLYKLLNRVKQFIYTLK